MSYSPAHSRASRPVVDIDLDSAASAISNTPGWLTGGYFFNAGSAIAYVKFYNKAAASVNPASDTPVFVFPLPHNSGNGAGAVFPPEMRIRFDTAISMRAVTGVDDTDTTDPGANVVIANAFFTNHATP